MKTIALLLLIAAAACTKQNPNICCIDEADCAAQGLPNDSQCAEGLLCRGNQCIAVTCSGSSECDASAPYCVNASCGETCTGDDQCPGFAQSATSAFCESGACVECHSNTDSDCPTDRPVCDANQCRQCRSHDECASGACGTNGTCVSETSISYVDVSGSATSSCSKAAPCSTVARALEQTSTYIVVSSGSYTSSASLLMNGEHVVIGRGLTRPILTRSTPGSVVTFASGDLVLDNVSITGGTSTTTDSGAGIACNALGGATKLRLSRVLLANNATGLRTERCVVDAVLSEFRNNTASGVDSTDSTVTLDRCDVRENGNGLYLDAGVYQVTNSFVVRNEGLGVNIFTNQGGSKVEFNTIVDNTTNGFECDLQNVTGSFPNNIIARNGGFQTTGANCSYPSSIIDASVTSLKFKSPDAMPFDYHLQANSIAIDAATISTTDHDYDGDVRPTGAGRDVGADEFVP